MHKADPLCHKVAYILIYQTRQACGLTMGRQRGERTILRAERRRNQCDGE